MFKCRSTYRIISLLLLTVILSHIAVFHADLENKVLCIHEDGETHIENLQDSHFSSKGGLSIDLNQQIFPKDCNDYVLDSHIDISIQKQSTNLRTLNYINLITTNLFYTKTLSKRSINFLSKNTNLSIDHLSTVTLLI